VSAVNKNVVAIYSDGLSSTIVITRRFIRNVVLVALLTGSWLPPVISKEKKPASPCEKPPEVLRTSKPSKEEQKKARKERMRGVIAVAISEDGDVIEANVVHASSKEAGKMVLNQVKSIKFKPRTGCGVYRTQLDITLAE
jgi:hypothetical protein